MKIGAHYLGDKKCRFTVWAPLLEDLHIRILNPERKEIALLKDNNGYWSVTLDNIAAGTQYLYLLPGNALRPDPVSFFQPEGVHNPSAVVDHNAFEWEDLFWKGVSLPEMIIYELHTGTFTKQATFEAIIKRLDDLKELGINAIELMPVAQFPGERNWGYDGVYPFAVQNSYGGPQGLKRLINICHQKGMAVILDVVYNHLGPEGNYLACFGPYFTDKYRTPWGAAVNFDDSYSDGVRNFFIENAIYWMDKYHIDALRLDAVHGIFDIGATHILAQLSKEVKAFSRKKDRQFYLIAESDLNDSRLIRPLELGGYGINAQWCDDFHHAIHTCLTRESQGYYQDFGRIEQMAEAVRAGFVYTGKYSTYRKKTFGNSYNDISANQLIVFSQNHDQIGNRMGGQRLCNLIDFEGLKLAAAAIILSPYIPLFFMGEEYAEKAPFLYFVSHSDSSLIEAVREGRKTEFASFAWQQEPFDPQAEETFMLSKLSWNLRNSGKNKVLLDFYKMLIKTRKTKSALSNLSKNRYAVSCAEDKKAIIARRWHQKERTALVMNFSPQEISLPVAFLGGIWKKIFCSADKKWDGPGAALPAEVEKKEELRLPSFSSILYARGG